MGKNFGARLVQGVPPPPGCPTAVNLGCTCPEGPNKALSDNTLGIVAATCPLHGWDRQGSGRDAGDPASDGGSSLG